MARRKHRQVDFNDIKLCPNGLSSFKQPMDFFLKGHLCLCEGEGNMRLTGIVQGIEILVLCGWTLFAKLNAVLLSVEY